MKNYISTSESNIRMDEETINTLKKAGKIGSETLKLGETMIRPGASVVKILDELDEFIKSKGAFPAFPSQIAINSTAAHFCPTDNQDVIIEEGSILKLDVGVSINGLIADNALTIDLGTNTELKKATREALNKALKLVHPGAKVRDIGKEIQETIMSYGYAPIRNLSGHGLSKFKVHAEPTIPNFDTGEETQLKENQVIAIEPFASTGAGIVYESSNPTLYSLINEKPPRSMMTREVLKEIKTYEGLPFTSRYLERKFGQGKTAFALRELTNNGSLQAHPPLLDKAKGLVSQAEHSVIVKEKPIIYTKFDD